MMSKVLYFASFATGAGIGAVATWFLVKRHYEAVAQEEINSVVKTFRKKNKTTVPEEMNKKKHDENIDKSSLDIYKNKISEAGYKNYSTTNEKERKEPSKPSEESNKSIEIIEASEFGFESDYDQVTWTYFSDDIVTDEYDEVVTEPELVLGEEALKKLQDRELDCVCVRNDDTGCYYELTYNEEKYADVVSSMPYSMRGLTDDDEY